MANFMFQVKCIDWLWCRYKILRKRYRHKIMRKIFFKIIVIIFFQMDHLRSGVQDQLGQHGKILSLLKIQEKNQPGMVVHACSPSYLRGWGRRIARTWEVEVSVSLDHAIVLQPGQQEQNSVSKKKDIGKLMELPREVANQALRSPRTSPQILLH